jgi:putative transposase
MGRKNLIRTDQYPYHVTIRTNNKEWFDIPMETVWKICKNCISRARDKVDVNIEAFVLMNNHYHLLLYTPDANLDKFMFFLNKYISHEIRTLTGRINRIFGDRYYWQIIQSDRRYQNVVRYIFQNPLRKKIVKRCENYRYSTLYYQARTDFFPCPLPQDFKSEYYLDFVNQVDEDFIDFFGKTKNGDII